MRHCLAGVCAGALVGLTLLAPQAAADEPSKWTGLYVGAHIGWGTGDVDHAQTNGGMPYGPFSYEADGVLGGATLGYNWQLQHVVVGIEAEAGYTDVSGDGKIASSVPTKYQVLDVDGGAYALIAGRLGFTWDSTLIYGKGGYAYVDGDAGQKTTNPGYETVRSDAFQGVVYGAGVEHLLSDRLSIKFEWLRFDFDTVTGYQENVSDASSTIGFRFANKTDLAADSFKVGVNYQLY